VLQNIQNMNLQIEINTIKKELEEIQDESLIQTIKSLLKFARKKSYESRLKPMSVKEYRARAEASEKDIKAGRVQDIEALEKESDNW
jgi:DNA-binding transcriptional regulator YhcF (GntR family)